MAKGASKSAVEDTGSQEVVAGEYRRAGAAPCSRRSAGYWRSRPSCTVGPVMILIAGSMICSISSPIPRSFWSRGIGCGGTRVPGPPGWTAALRRPSRRSTGVEEFLDALRDSLKDRSFRPLPVRERMIPKAGGKLRRLGIATITDRVVQASLKLVLEPIFEADFLPCSYGFRPNRRAHDAVAEVRHSDVPLLRVDRGGRHQGLLRRDLASGPSWTGCAIAIGDKRVLALVKAFLKAGILGEDRVLRENNAGTPQGSILSPLLSNVALSVLDEHIAHGPGGPAPPRWQRAKRRRHGLPNYRLVRYADDWCLVVSGTKADAEALREEIAGVLSTMGLRLSPEKTLITHIDEGLDFLGLAHPAPPQTRHRPALRLHLPGTQGRQGRDRQGEDAVPANGHEPAARCPAAPAQPAAAGLVRLLPARGVQRDLRLPERLHVGAGHADGCAANTAGSPGRNSAAATAVDGWWPATKERTLFNPAKVRTTRYRYRGAVDPDSLADHGMRSNHDTQAGLVERPLP